MGLLKKALPYVVLFLFLSGLYFYRSYKQVSAHELAHAQVCVYLADGTNFSRVYLENGVWVGQTQCKGGSIEVSRTHGLIEGFGYQVIVSQNTNFLLAVLILFAVVYTRKQ